MGKLITVEGGEYTGKTSLIVPSLRDILRAAGFNVKTSREPGGTREGEKIRERIFTRLKEGAGQEELAVLFNKAREIHLREVILPFLGRNREKDGILILDRYLDSTRVYQGLEGGVPLETLARHERDYAGSFYPDLTLIAFFPEERFAETFGMRSRFANKNDEGSRSRTEWDEGEIQTHLQRQRHYLSLPDTYQQMGIPRRFALVDASGDPFEVVRQATIRVGAMLDNSPALLTEYQRLVSEGRWADFDEIWRQQQKGFRTSVEGVRRTKER